MQIYKDYSLLKHNTFGIDARCRKFVEYATTEEAVEVAKSLTKADEPLLLLGGGSNLLLTGDYPGTVLHSAVLGRDEIRETAESVWLRCGSGEVFDDIVDYAVSHDWHGAENLSLIPGEVGASAVQNIGAYGAEACDIIDQIEAVELATGAVVNIKASNCGYSYRQSKFKHEWRDKYLITHVTYRFNKTFSPRLDYGNIRKALEEKGIVEPTARQLRDTIIEIRRRKLPDPKDLGNAGSFFMNPIVDAATFHRLLKDYPDMPHYVIKGTDGAADSYKIPAGWMIEQCGWKGRSLGRAGVYSKQALVLVNLGGATGQDVANLCHTVQHAVKNKFDIEIHPEVNIR